MWTTQQAIELCRKVEPIVARFGCHIALTGGLLYKDGPRKDCDLIVYREGLDFGKERGSFSDEVDRDALLFALADIDLHVLHEFVRVVKCGYGLSDQQYQHVDLIFPELDGEYAPDEKGTALLDDAKPVPGVDDFTQFAPAEDFS